MSFIWFLLYKCLCALQSAEPQKTLMLSTSSSISWLEFHADLVSVCACVCECVCGRGTQSVQYPWEREAHPHLCGRAGVWEMHLAVYCCFFCWMSGKLAQCRFLNGWMGIDFVAASSRTRTHTHTQGERANYYDYTGWLAVQLTLLAWL